ncbi:hypothetical protein PHMEG_00012906 [Phytophthora megakarya]|uniref:Uncharacterized protein n=1 Tax=Phytophthora megakarya TaxID=4795 RepID=A0A225W9Q4_9STRA|nr:hypothetical protein PHMEG_00012906 [Phytophthora megakarya]
MTTNTATAASNRVGWTRTRFSSKPPLDLHRRCAETIERCSAKLRERQRKMERLNLVLPLPNSCPEKRTTPPRPTKRNKHSVGSVRNRDKSSSNVTSPAWSISSRSARLRFDAMTMSPLVNRNSERQMKTISPFQVSNTKRSDKTTQESTPASQSEDTVDLSSAEKSPGSAQEKSTELSPTWAQRQQDFMAAIEAEADASPLQA